jgi:hypothetical protein
MRAEARESKRQSLIGRGLKKREEAALAQASAQREKEKEVEAITLTHEACSPTLAPLISLSLRHVIGGSP